MVASCVIHVGVYHRSPNHTVSANKSTWTANTCIVRSAFSSLWGTWTSFSNSEWFFSHMDLFTGKVELSLANDDSQIVITHGHNQESLLKYHDAFSSFVPKTDLLPRLIFSASPHMFFHNYFNMHLISLEWQSFRNANHISLILHKSLQNDWQLRQGGLV